MANEYAQQWFDVFCRSIDGAQTKREVEFVCQQLPLGQFDKVLDLCCGMGRHSQLLLQQGYSVVGLDNSAQALAVARACATTGTFFPTSVIECGHARAADTISYPWAKGRAANGDFRVTSKVTGAR